MKATSHAHEHHHEPAASPAPDHTSVASHAHRRPGRAAANEGPDRHAGHSVEMFRGPLLDHAAADDSDAGLERHDSALVRLHRARVPRLERTSRQSSARRSTSTAAGCSSRAAFASCAIGCPA